jgi:hypothetical protein
MPGADNNGDKLRVFWFRAWNFQTFTAFYGWLSELFYLRRVGR